MPKLEEVATSKSPSSRKKLSSKSKSQTEKQFKSLRRFSKKVTMNQQNNFIESKTLPMKMQMKNYDVNNDLEFEEDKTNRENTDGEKLHRSDLITSNMSENSLEEVNANELTVQHFKPLRLSVQYDQYSHDAIADTYAQTNNHKPNSNNLYTTNSNASRSVNDSKNSDNRRELNRSSAGKDNIIEKGKAELACKPAEVIPKEIMPAQTSDDEQKMMESIRLFFHKIQPNV